MPRTELKSDTEIDDWIRNTVITINHPLGTCAMGRGSDAVLNPDLMVRGVEALRVSMPHRCRICRRRI